MRNIGLVSAAAIAMAAMAGTVAASAPPVIQQWFPTDNPNSESVRRFPFEERMRMFGGQVGEQILAAVALAEREGLSGEAAQQRIRDYLLEKLYLDVLRPELSDDPRAPFAAQEHHPFSQREMYIALGGMRRSLINSNRLGRGSDGDLGVSAVLARPAELVAERERAASAAAARPAESRAERNMEGRNLPGNAAAGQPATDAGTTGIRQSRATYDSDLDDGYDPDLDDEYDPDLDDEAGEPD